MEQPFPTTNVAVDPPAPDPLPGLTGQSAPVPTPVFTPPLPAPLPPTSALVGDKVVDMMRVGKLTVLDWREIKRRGGGDIVKANSLRDFGIDGLPIFLSYVCAKANPDIKPADIDALGEEELGALMYAYAAAEAERKGTLDRPT